MNIDAFAAPHMHPGLNWLGRIPDWFTLSKDTKSDDALTGPIETGVCGIRGTLLRTKGLDQHPWLMRFLYEINVKKRDTLEVFELDALAMLVAEGPKLFRPNVEQFESMRHVELHLPASDFRSPFRTLVIQVPNECRKSIAAANGYPLDQMPFQVLVSYRHVTGQPSLVFVKIPFASGKHFTVFSDAVMVGKDIEDVLAKPSGVRGDAGFQARNNEALSRVATELARVCLNLCLMLTHYGHEVGGPLNPNDYRRHRAQKHLAHFKFGDYLTVNMKQSIVVRRPLEATQNPPGPGTGIEVAPHWRKGHWRCYPGQAAKRAAGEIVPLLFVKPHLVRSDRAVGELCHTESTYHG